MPEPLFLSQQQLESWVDSGEVTQTAYTLTVIESQAQFILRPAVKIVRLLDGIDIHYLAGQVRTIMSLEVIGAEVLPSSVLLGDSVYEAHDGYQCIAITPTSPAPITPEEVIEHRARADSGDLDLLTAYMLANT